MKYTPVSAVMYPHHWQDAVCANQSRYPSNDRVPMLKSSEILLDEVYLNQQELVKCKLDHIGPAQEDNTTGEWLSSAFFPDDLDIFSSVPQDTRQDNTLPAVVPGGVPVPTKLLCEQVEIPVIPSVGIRHIVRRCRVAPDVPTLVKKTLQLSEFVVLHESWIDTRRQELLIVSVNETWADRAIVGDVTIYRALPTSLPLRGKVPMLPTPDGRVVSPTDPCCLFMQYAYFQVHIKIPFRSSIEQSLLKAYNKTTADGRKLDMTLIQEHLEAHESTNDNEKTGQQANAILSH